MRSGETILHEISEADEYVGKYRSVLWDWFASAMFAKWQGGNSSALRNIYGRPDGQGGWEWGLRSRCRYGDHATLVVVQDRQRIPHIALRLRTLTERIGNGDNRERGRAVGLMSDGVVGVAVLKVERAVHQHYPGRESGQIFR